MSQSSSSKIKIGIFGGGFKPFTKGHYAVTVKAAQENDLVYLYVSTGDRKRKGEQPIKWEDMERVWEYAILDTLPKNVLVRFVPSPVGAIMDELYSASECRLYPTEYTVYADKKDLQSNFQTSRTLTKCKTLLDHNELCFVGLPRLHGASGTKTREFLQTGDYQAFKQELPEPIRFFAPEMFALLGSDSA